MKLLVKKVFIVFPYWVMAQFMLVLILLVHIYLLIGLPQPVPQQMDLLTHSNLIHLRVAQLIQAKKFSMNFVCYKTFPRIYLQTILLLEMARCSAIHSTG